MSPICPHCQQRLALSKQQQRRLQETLKHLKNGKQLAITCPQCKQRFTLNPSATGSRLQPPPPPELDWLNDGLYQGEEMVEDVPMALVLLPENSRRRRVVKAIESVGYQAFTADSVSQALEKMRFTRFACVIQHTAFEHTLARSRFHQFMCRMPMPRRRYIFYILIGPEFHTLYDLEALACSANLVVNERDLDHFNQVLRKAIPDYEELFAPLMEELSVQGRR